MFICFPINTILLIIATMIASAASIWFILAQGLAKLSIAENVRRRWIWSVAILLITWLLVRLAFAAFPPGDAVLANQFLITFISLGIGLFVGILLLLISPVFRQVIRAVPETWLVAIHSIRLAGFLFLALLDMRLLPSEFALSAGYGDMTVGLLALVMVYLLAKKKPYARTLVIGWNALGLLDFIAALTTGGIYILPFAAQLMEAGISLSYLNYVLVVPSFGVPLYALLHIYSLVQMFSKHASEPRRVVEGTIQTDFTRDKITQ